MSTAAAVTARNVRRRPFRAPREAVRLVEAEGLLLVVRRGAVAVERGRDHHGVRKRRGPGAGGTGRGHEGAEVEEWPEGEEGRPGGKRLQVAGGGGVPGQRPVGAAVSTATAGAADARGGAVRRTLIRGGGGAG